LDDVAASDFVVRNMLATGHAHTSVITLDAASGSNQLPK
jgi:hypothetical protein